MGFHPSAGVGGHCIPIDPSYLAWSAEQAGGTAKFINLANEVNLGMPEFVVDRVLKLFGGAISKRAIRVIGVAYKPNVSDTRETPAQNIVSMLRAHGAQVTWHDPYVGTWLGETSHPLIGEYDLGLIVTAHSDMQLSSLIDSGVLLFDTTGMYRHLAGVIAL
ncbi:UDP-N-acetyl-D-glucosamine 6-dehydrogenase [mine drainage metagenome]|uniref:UDP-N-acetyl-D-glucosamine 6-dehydrogenase n=1 Tax=mine drainage metagenome TaxID=410659 RepID=A0A1J5Q2P7_9ZZZZ